MNTPIMGQLALPYDVWVGVKSEGTTFARSNRLVASLEEISTVALNESDAPDEFVP